MRPALATAAVAYPPSQIGIGWAGVGVTRTSYRPSSGAQNLLPGPGGAQGPDQRLQPDAPGGRVDTECPVLVLGVAEAQPENQPSAAEPVDHGGVLGQPQRVVQRRQDEPGAQRDPRGDRGERGQQGQR